MNPAVSNRASGHVFARLLCAIALLLAIPTAAQSPANDSDIHLVVADPKLGGSMIVEFPSDTCTAAAAPSLRAAMTQARTDLATACGGEAGSKPVTLTGSATISGVGFFDVIHGQAGVAPNGIELHPALTFTSTNCQRVTVKHRG